MDGEVLLGGEDLEEEAVQAAVDVPIDVAEVVARLVAAVVGELQPHAAPQRGAVVLALPPKQLARQQVQGFELAHEVGVEERRDGFSRWGKG